MNRPLIIILILLFLAFLFLGARYIGKKLCGIGPAVAAAPIGAGNACGTWAFDDGEAFEAKTNRYYRFKKDQSRSIASTSEDFTNAIKGTVNYLRKNKDRKLKITGLYESVEKNSRNNTNLGIARANDIKSKLANMGVPSDQLEVDSEILREDVVEADTLCKGAFFTFYPKGNANSKARTATSYVAAAAAVAPAVSAGKSLVGKSMVIYFGTNKDELNLSRKEKKDMQDIKAYLDATPSARLEVSGHTDNRGDASYNKRLSRGRAKFTSEQLTKRFGIKSNRMNVVGYGEERPIDNTNTAAGLAKNRRVEILLKEK